MSDNSTGETVAIPMGERGSTVGNSGGNSDMVGLSVDSGSEGLLDDGLTGNGDGVGNLIGGIDMDGGWDLNDLFGVDGDIIRNIDATFDIVGFVDGVDLGLLGDDGWVGGDGSTEDGGDSDGEMGGRGLDDACGVAGHIGGLAQVDLFGDNGLGLVDGGHTGSLGLSGVGGGNDRGDGGSVSDSHRGGVGQSGASVAQVAQAEVSTPSCQAHGGKLWGRCRSGKHKCQGHEAIHFVYLRLSG